MILSEGELRVPDEILKAQKTFRVLVSAMSHPGKIYSLSSIETESKAYLPLIVHTLFDSEVTYATLGVGCERLAEEIDRLTGAKHVQIENADFIVILGGNSHGEIVRARLGTADYPDRGATLIYFLKGDEYDSVTLKLRGPGIKEDLLLKIVGVAKEEFWLLQNINKNYPLGLDSIFLYNTGELFCLPRSTRILEVI